MQNRTLDLNIERSEINFNATHMGFLQVEGTFTRFEASLQLDGENLKSIAGHIDVASIHTDESTRDKTLLSDGYLHVAAFPQIRFSGTSIRKATAGNRIEGELTIKDQTRSLSIPCQFTWQEDRSILLEAELSLSRKHFDLDFGGMDALIGDQIDVSLHLFFE